MDDFAEFMAAFASDFASFLPYSLHVVESSPTSIRVVDELMRGFIAVRVTTSDFTVTPLQHFGKLSDADQSKVTSAIAVATMAFLRVYHETARGTK